MTLFAFISFQQYVFEDVEESVKMGKKIGIAFGLWFAIMFAIGWLSGSDAKQLNLEHVAFRTSDADELYFRNVRSFFYHLDDQDSSGFNLYQLKKIYDSKEAYPILPVIVHDWRSSEAYLHFKFKEGYEQCLMDASEYPDQAWELKASTQENYQYQAKRLFNAIKSGAKIEVKKNGELFPLFSDEMEKKRMKTVLNDYFKLTGQIR